MPALSLREMVPFTKVPWLRARARSFTDIFPGGPGPGGIVTGTPVARIDSVMKCSDYQPSTGVIQKSVGEDNMTGKGWSWDISRGWIEHHFQRTSQKTSSIQESGDAWPLSRMSCEKPWWRRLDLVGRENSVSCVLNFRKSPRLIRVGGLQSVKPWWPSQ